MIKKIYIVFCLLLFIYMMWPIPSKITQFVALPNSEKSTLEGDTIQIPNVLAYFSNSYRDFVVAFYKNNYWSLSNTLFPPYRLNYPPEYSFVAIKKHTDTTYLEELVYPLKGSLFVNGFEPFNPDHTPKYWGATRFHTSNNTDWDTKTTLRLYPSSIWARVIVWIGIIVSLVLTYNLSKRILSKE